MKMGVFNDQQMVMCIAKRQMWSLHHGVCIKGGIIQLPSTGFVLCLVPLHTGALDPSMPYIHKLHACYNIYIYTYIYISDIAYIATASPRTMIGQITIPKCFWSLMKRASFTQNHQLCWFYRAVKSPANHH